MRLFKKSKILILGLLVMMIGAGFVGCTDTSDSAKASGDDKKAEEQKQEEKVYGVGDIYKYKDDYSLKIDSVKTTKERNQFEDKKAKEVVIITYTYENLNSDKDLFIDSMAFKVYDADGNAVDTYPANIEKMPEAVSKGRKCTAQMAYAVNSGDTLELEYYDNMFNSKKDTIFKLNFKN